MGLSQPLFCQRVCPSPQNRGGAHSPAGEGLGESQFRRLEIKRIALCLLCESHSRLILSTDWLPSASLTSSLQYCIHLYLVHICYTERRKAKKETRRGAAGERRSTHLLAFVSRSIPQILYQERRQHKSVGLFPYCFLYGLLGLPVEQKLYIDIPNTTPWLFYIQVCVLCLRYL